MFVVELKVARWERCLMRYSRVLWGKEKYNIGIFVYKTYKLCSKSFYLFIIEVFEYAAL